MKYIGAGLLALAGGVIIAADIVTNREPSARIMWGAGLVIAALIGFFVPPRSEPPLD